MVETNVAILCACLPIFGPYLATQTIAISHSMFSSHSSVSHQCPQQGQQQQMRKLPASGKSHTASWGNMGKQSKQSDSGTLLPSEGTMEYTQSQEKSTEETSMSSIMTAVHKVGTNEGHDAV